MLCFIQKKICEEGKMEHKKEKINLKIFELF